MLNHLREWPDIASCGSVGATAPFVSRPVGSNGDGGSGYRVTRCRGRERKTLAPLPLP